MHASSYHNKLYLASSVDFLPDANDARIFTYDIGATDISYAGSIDIHNPPFQDLGYGHFATITSITENPDDGTLYAAGFMGPRLADDYRNTDPCQSIFTTPTLAVVPSDPCGLIIANEIVDSDLALPLSIVWTGSIAQPCDGANLDGLGDVDFADFAILASQWQQTGPGLSADIAPVPDGDGAVDIQDLAVLAEHWLDTNCN